MTFSQNWSESSDICIIGDQGQAGTYLLRIELTEDMQVSFGRFDDGRIIDLDQGKYVYIGSALASKGSTTLGNRISRHCDRSDPKPPHNIRETFREFGDNLGIKYAKNPADKTPFWNIDHLTNLQEAEITGIIAIRSKIPLENTWSEFMEEQEYTSVFAKGLGANDAAGHTHLQSAHFMKQEQWRKLPSRLPKS